MKQLTMSYSNTRGENKKNLHNYLEAAIGLAKQMLEIKNTYFSYAYPLPLRDILRHSQFRVSVQFGENNKLQAAWDGQIREKAIRHRTIIPPRRYAWSMDVHIGNCKGISVVFAPDFIRVVYAERYEKEQKFDNIIWYHTTNPICLVGLPIIQVLDCIADEQIRPPVTIKSLIIYLLELVIPDMKLDEISMPRGKVFYTWQMIVRYICENFHYPIDRDEAATKFNLFPAYISQLFQKYGKENFNAYCDLS